MKRRTAVLLALGALLALNAALLLVQSGLALPGSLAAYLLGPKMVKAEVVVKDGGVTYDYRLDQGKVRAVGPSSLTLYERTGDVVIVFRFLSTPLSFWVQPRETKGPGFRFSAVRSRSGQAASPGARSWISST